MWRAILQLLTLIPQRRTCRRLPILRLAGATTVTGTITTLSVTAADDGGESKLTYTWSVFSGGDAYFSENGSNAAKNTTVTFCEAGTYVFQVIVTDAFGASDTRLTLGHNRRSNPFQH